MGSVILCRVNYVTSDKLIGLITQYLTGCDTYTLSLWHYLGFL